MASPQMIKARMRDAEQVLSADELDCIRRVCRDHPYVRELYLFGSRARGTQWASSDYDFYASFDEDLMQTRIDHLKFIDELISALQQRVDLMCGEVWSSRDERLKARLREMGCWYMTAVPNDDLSILSSVRGMRNRLAHDYSHVDRAIVWETISDGIEELDRVAKDYIEKRGLE